jgi:nucleotide-binding universal stress UspA family protein
MKKILVPTDFSPYADAALEFARTIARKTQAEILLMHVYLTPINWPKLDIEQEKLFPDTRAAIKQARILLADRVRDTTAQGIAATDYLHFSDGKEQLIKFLGLDSIEMIVMGSHGKYGFKQHVLGSNTYTVLRKFHIPVLVVREAHKTLQLKKVVLATDFKLESGRAFQKITDMVRMIGAEPELLYVNTPADFLENSQIMQLADGFLAQFGSYAYPVHIYSAYKVERGIIQFAQNTGADAVAIITHGRNDLQQLFSPSVTENLISYLDLPVLSLNITTAEDRV